MKRNSCSGWQIYVILAYTAVVSFSTYHHEPWADEAQAWLIARDLPYLTMFKQMAYEGTPGLWHFVLSVFAKTAFPYWTVKVLHLAIAIAAITIFLYRAPFTRVTKILFVFSYHMSYVYSIIARNYNISILIFFLIASYYQRRYRHPFIYVALILLLFNTNVHCLFAALSLMLIYLYESKVNKRFAKSTYVGIGVMLAGLITVGIQLIPTNGRQYSGRSVINLTDSLVIISDTIKGALFVPSSYLPHLPLIFGIFIIIAACLFLQRRSKPALFFLIFSIVWILLIFIKYKHGFRHYGFILIFILCALWISTDKVFPKTNRRLPNSFIVAVSIILTLLGLSCNEYLLTSLFSADGSLETITRVYIWLFDFALVGLGLSILFSKGTRFMVSRLFTNNEVLYKYLLMAVNISLSLSVLASIKSHIREYNGQFSGAKAMASYLKKNSLTRHMIIAHRAHPCSAILPYLPETKFWYADLEEYGTFSDWSKKRTRNITEKEILSLIDRYGFREDEPMLLLTDPLSEELASDYSLIYKVTDNVFGRERFFLYRRLAKIGF